MIRYAANQLTVSREYAVAAAVVWKIITDTRQWPIWGPSVVAVQCPDQCITAASAGRVRTSLGIWLPFTITRFTAGEFWSWRIGRVEATGHHVQALGAERCRLSFTMPWWAGAYLPVCSLALRRIQKECIDPGG